MLPSIIIFVFDLILGSFWAFWGDFGRQGKVQTPLLGSNHALEHLLFYMFPSILTFDFKLILRVFF